MYCEDGPDFYTERLVTARREHKCSETGAIIHKGDKYWRCVGKWDGDVQTFKQCQAAYMLCRVVNLHILKECQIYFGGLGEWMANARYYDGSNDPIVQWYDAIRKEATHAT